MIRRVSLILLTAWLAACRQAPVPEAGPDDPPIVPEIAGAAPEGRSVVFVGLDGADWELLDIYVREGRMPNLAALIREGRTGVLTTIQPPLSPLVWTTEMTGVSPLVHGILDFTRFHPKTGEREPIPRDERRVPAVWNMASAAGRSVAVFGMWATWPAEPVRGLLVADRFSSFTASGPPPAGSVYPQDRDAWARQILERTEREVDFAALRSYLPDLTEAEFREAVSQPDPYAHPVSALQRILVETRVWDALARTRIAELRPHLSIVYFQGTDTIGHVFAPYAPPRRPEVAEADYARFHRVPELYFAEIDRLLGEYRDLAEWTGAVLMLASDHGFRWREARPEKLSSAAVATAGRWHRDEGIYLLWGPGISPGTRERASVDRVCSTLLSLLGLPSGAGLAGPPLPGTPELPGKTVDYRALLPAAPVPSPAGTQSTAEIEKLRSLGYVGRSEPMRAPAGTGSTRTPASFNNEGLLLRQAGRTREAAVAFERALALDPHSASALWNLSELLYAEGREPERSDDLLVQAAAAGLPEAAERAGSRALELGRAGQAERASRLLDRAPAALPDDPGLLLLRGRLHLDRHDCASARADFAEASRLAPENAVAWASLGLSDLCLGEAAAARRALERSLAIDPAQPQVRAALRDLPL
ncbi:MAG TPA: alkaline phosphatase family protein [Thermoanaerobaculia bacterium]|nr:alkaline phosphatase family protein [Thermoanaerobaculia bacterium]